MPLEIRTPPASGDYAPYYHRYVSLVPDGDVLGALERQIGETLDLMAEFGETRGGYRYAPDKWSVKEVAGHMADTERIFAYRALRFARTDRTPLPGYDQDEYVRHAGSDARTLADLAAELESVRRATLTLFRGVSEEALGRRGVANDVEFAVRAFPYIIAGHERHHLRILRERYRQG